MTGKQAKEKLTERYKKQNERIRKSYDRLSVTVPKGYKKLISDNFGSVNGYINRIITDDLKDKGII